MEEAKKILEGILEKMGFSDFSVQMQEEGKRLVVFINDAPFIQNQIPALIGDFDLVLKLALKKSKLDFVHIDINNYRKEREDLIIKLARAAARKSADIKKEIPLPAMNAYERRIVHAELAAHPDIKTESVGEGKTRHIVIKPIE